MNHIVEEKVLSDYLSSAGLKRSLQRVDVLRVFLDTEKHLTPEELHALVKKKNRKVGIATVYRALKLFCESGLARELMLDDGSARYEHNFEHDHHDHLICTKCRKVVEVVDDTIEKLQDAMARNHGFFIQKHKLEIYGVCSDCR